MHQTFRKRLLSSKTILICLLISGHSHAETASKRKPLTATEKLATEVNLYIHQFNKDQSSSNTAIGADTKTKRSIPLNARNYWNNKFHQTLVKLASSEINGQIETHDPHSAWAVSYTHLTLPMSPHV